MSDKLNDIRVVSIGLRKNGIELESDIAWTALGKVAEKYIEFDKYTSVEGSNKFKISKIDEKENELGYVSISDEEISIAIDEKVTFSDWKKLSSNILKIILNYIKVSPLSISHIDSRYLRRWKTDVHHSRMFYDLFMSDSKMKESFSNLNIAQFYPDLKYVLSNEDQIILAIKFSNNTSLFTDMLLEFPDKYEFIIGSGIAKVGNYKPSTNINDVLTEIHKYSKKYHDGVLKNSIFKTISNYIASNTKKK